ncbi:hypothetical protein D9756_011183 [Leucocoprinus leucothites]|uniref:Metallothionein n=1 Tax=Leucocoprinus leucothites TaxID=201217 RepID=A0A8H5CN38_9AGAR|nr:hypothetical protein D9756_011183 [Leucoagaricus leucothites]
MTFTTTAVPVDYACGNSACKAQENCKCAAGTCKCTENNCTCTAAECTCNC